MAFPWADLSSGLSAVSSIAGMFGGSKQKRPQAEEEVAHLHNRRDMSLSEAYALHQSNMMASDMKSRMAAADKYGINKLMMLGVNPASMGAPQSVFGGDSGPSVGDRVASMGAGLSRAAEAMMSKEDRVINRQSAMLQLENQKLQNDRLRSEISLMSQPGSPPSQWQSAHDAAAGKSATRYFVNTPDGPVMNWTDDVLRQMESDYVRVPLEYIRAGYNDFVAKPGKALGRYIRGMIEGR